jgi:hypothetical protein
MREYTSRVLLLLLPSRAGWATGPSPKKIIKKQKKKYVCINKNNINLLVYSLTPESGIKISV